NGTVLESTTANFTAGRFSGVYLPSSNNSRLERVTIDISFNASSASRGFKTHFYSVIRNVLSPFPGGDIDCPSIVVESGRVALNGAGWVGGGEGVVTINQSTMLSKGGFPHIKDESRKLKTQGASQ